MQRVVSFEISTQDPKKTGKFYSNVFGWEVGKEEDGYQPATTGTQDKAGIDGGISKGPSDFPHGTRLKIEVDSIEASIKLALKNGANVLREKMEFEDHFLAYIVDPVGIVVGLIERK